MKLVNADYTFDGRKAVFYFIAEESRRLSRPGARSRQRAAGSRRDEANRRARRDQGTGGLGPCGRELCCSSWLRDFEAVTVKMARDQGLALNPSRLAGMCGRLKCCLRYEYATYVELKRGLPNPGKRVQCVKGDGKVIRQNILKQTVLIQREEDGGVVEATLEDLVDARAPQSLIERRRMRVSQLRSRYDGDRVHITTAIFYSNGPPHVGHAYEALAADVFARYQRRKLGKQQRHLRHRHR